MNAGSSRIYLATAIAIASLGLAACKQDAPSQPTGATSPAVAPVTAPAVAPGAVVAEVMAGEERMQMSTSGERTDGKVRSTGAGGVLVFGPYLSLPIGDYSLLIEGSSTTPFSVDVVHSSGSKQLGAREYSADSGNAAGSGSLAVLDFQLGEQVDDAEFRVLVADDADTVVYSYKVVTR